MTVHVKNLGISVIASALAQFSRFGPYNFPSESDFFASFGGIGEAHVDFAVVAPNLLMNVGFATNTTLCLTPWAIPGVKGNDQYAQFRLVSNTGTAANPTRPALFTFARGISSLFDNSLTSFAMRFRNDIPQTDILTTTAYNPQTHIVVASVGSTPVAGDLVRFEARRNGANVDLNVLVNSISVLTFTSGLLPPVGQGLPGFGVNGTWFAGGVQVRITEFECGIL